MSALIKISLWTRYFVPDREYTIFESKVIEFNETPLDFALNYFGTTYNRMDLPLGLRRCKNKRYRRYQMENRPLGRTRLDRNLLHKRWTGRGAIWSRILLHQQTIR